MRIREQRTKLTVKTGTTVAGSAAGPEGTLIGMAAGEAVGMKIENTFYRAEQKSRMMKYFMDKLKPGDEQNDSIFKLAGSLIKNKMAYMIKQATLNQLMSACITSNPSGGQTGGSNLSGLKGSLTPQEITSIIDKITNPIQKTVASFVLSKVGYPYSQNLRNSGKVFDCSSLAYYAWKSAGIDIAFGGSTTAAAEAQGLKDKSVKEKDIQPGDLIFYSYTINGRYKNISHVGIYVGNGKMVEAVDEAHGVCLGNYHNGGLVMICRLGK